MKKTPATHSTDAPYSVRKWLAFEEETLATGLGFLADGAPLVKIAIAAVLKNPFAGVFGEELDGAVRASRNLGTEFARRLEAHLRGRSVESYGKACAVGMRGEHEHGNAFLTTDFADPLRRAVGGGMAWVPSTGKRGAAGVSVDVPLAYKDALYVRSHYDTVTLSIADAPADDEIVVVFACATRGRLYARLGGLTVAQASRADGLR